MKIFFILSLFISSCSYAVELVDANLTQKQVSSSEEGPYCEYNFSVNKQDYAFSRFDSCGSANVKNIGENYYLLALLDGRANHQTYFLMQLTDQIIKKAEINIGYDMYNYGFSIIDSEISDVVIDKNIKLSEEQNVNAILYFLGLVDKKNVTPNTIMSKIFTWNKDNKICDSTIVSFNHYKNTESVICKGYFSSEYKYYYIKKNNVEMELSGKFNGQDFMFKNGRYQYIVNAQSGQLTVKKNDVVITQKNVTQ